MPDADFLQSGNLLSEKGEILQVQVMSCIQPEAACNRNGGGFAIRSNSAFTAVAISGSICLSIQFDPVGSRIDCSLHSTNFRIDEKGGPHTETFYFGNDVAQERSVTKCIPARIGCQDIWRIRNQRRLGRSHLPDELQEFLRWIPFDIEFRTEYGFQCENIGPSDVTFVRTGMYGNALGTEAFQIDGCLHHVRHVSTTRITQGGDLVDVDR